MTSERRSVRTRVRRRIKQVYTAGSAAVRPPWVAVGHYYSPLTSHSDVKRAVEHRNFPDLELTDINYNFDDEANLMRSLFALFKEMVQGERYKQDDMYKLADAQIYYAMIRTFEPRRIIEIGSGYSTAVALDTIEHFDLKTEITCIEPNTARLRSLLKPEDAITIIEKQVQDVPLSAFDQLDAGDFLFIDSTHVVKPGSDVVHDLMNVLPRLKPGVLVHIHDIFWPFEYPESWLLARRDWNEAYMVHALLSNNCDWRIRLFADRIWPTMQSNVSADRETPAALWIEKLPHKDV